MSMKALFFSPDSTVNMQSSPPPWVIVVGVTLPVVVVVSIVVIAVVFCLCKFHYHKRIKEICCRYKEINMFVDNLACSVWFWADKYERAQCQCLMFILAILYYTFQLQCETWLQPKHFHDIYFWRTSTWLLDHTPNCWWPHPTCKPGNSKKWWSKKQVVHQ